MKRTSFIAHLSLTAVMGLAVLGVNAVADDEPYRVEVLAAELEYPWSLAQLPDGSLLITEKPGSLVHLSADYKTRREVAGVPEVAWVGQGGLLDVVIHPNFAQPDDRWVYLSYSKECASGFTTALHRYRWQEGVLVDGKLLFEAQPCGGLTWHFAGRIAFDDKQDVYLAIGDRGERKRVQSLETHWGKIIRLHADGRVPTDNPFVGREDALPEIYSSGHRNPQGMAWHKRNRELWLHEHGPRGGDELNRVIIGANYGWPLVTHGREYTGGVISEHTHAPGIEPPILDWTPSIAPSGLAIYDGQPFAAWQGNFLVGALKFQQLHRVQYESDGQVREWVLPKPQGMRIRDVRVLEDGLIYALIDAQDGQLLRLVPEAYNP